MNIHIAAPTTPPTTPRQTPTTPPPLNKRRRVPTDPASAEIIPQRNPGHATLARKLNFY